MAFSESEFHQRIDATLAAIEAAIEAAVEASGAEIDFESSGGVLTLSFADGSRIIVNRQTPNRELWVAAPSGGFHFAWDGAGWRTTRDGRPLAEVLSACASEQAGSPLELAC